MNSEPDIYEALYALVSVIKNSGSCEELRRTVGAYQDDTGHFVSWSMPEILANAEAALSKAEGR